MKAVTNSKCSECGRKKLSVQYMERLMGSEAGSFVTDINKAWRAYQAGGAQMYGSYRRPEKQAVEELRCNCLAVAAMTPTERVLREQYREQLLAKFGSEVSLSLLLALPSKFVAWENSALVNLESKDGQLVVSSEGASLLDLVLRMAMRGQFTGGMSKMSESDVISAYTYLIMVKPIFRTEIAVQLGPRVTVRQFFSAVEPDWIDWKSMMSMHCVTSDDGELHVVRAPGVSAVVALSHELVFGLDRMCRSAVQGTPLSVMSTCAQFLPGHYDRDKDPSIFPLTSEDQIVHVNLADGSSFLPVGPVVLMGSKQAVTFDPGVDVVAPDGTVLHNSHGGVTLFIDGQIFAELRQVELPQFNYYSHACTDFREYRVGARTVSYAAGTALGKWYNRTFDVLSTTARFVTQQARVLLLNTPASAGTVESTSGLWTLGVTRYDNGAGATDCHYMSLVLDVSYGLPREPAVYAGACVDGPYALEVGGTCLLTSSSRVATIGKTKFKIVRKCDSGIVHWSSQFETDGSAQFQRYTIADEYIVDGGGPSGSDGEYFDEVGTYVDVGGHPDWLFKTDDVPPDKRWPFLMLMNDHVRAVRHFGGRPTMGGLLAAPSSMFDLDAVGRTGFKKRDSGWRIVDLNSARYTWQDVVKSTAAWDSTGLCVCYLKKRGECLVHFEPDSFGRYLVSKNADSLLSGFRSNAVCM